MIVVTPKRYNKNMLLKFISENQAWIHGQLAKIKLKKDFLESDTAIRILGKLYQKLITVDPLKPSQIQLHKEQIELITPEESVTKLKKLTERFLKQTAEQYLLPRISQLAKKMDTTYKAVKLGEHSSQWGSCTHDGRLSFNWRLIHAPREVIDYVIVHELAHRTHHNHSAAFWQLVEKFDPNYKQNRRWLKKFGLSVG